MLSHKEKTEVDPIVKFSIQYLSKVPRLSWFVLLNAQPKQCLLPLGNFCLVALPKINNLFFNKTHVFLMLSNDVLSFMHFFVS